MLNVFGILIPPKCVYLTPKPQYWLALALHRCTKLKEITHCALPLPIFEERGDIFVCACAFVLKNAKKNLLTLVACTIDFSSQSFECIRDALILYSCKRSISSLYMISPYENRLFYLTEKDFVLPQIVYTNDQIHKVGSCLNLK